MVKEPVRIEDIVRGTRYSEMISGAFNEKGARAATSTFIVKFFEMLGGHHEDESDLTMNEKNKIASAALQAPITSLIDTLRDSEVRFSEADAAEFNFDEESLDPRVLAQLTGAIKTSTNETLRALEEVLSDMPIWDMSEVRTEVKSFLDSPVYRNYAGHMAVMVSSKLHEEQLGQFDPNEPDPADDISFVGVPEDGEFDPEWQESLKSSKVSWKNSLIKMYTVRHFLEEIEEKYGEGQITRRMGSKGAGHSYKKSFVTIFENDKVRFSIKMIQDKFRVGRKFPGEKMEKIGLYYDLRKAREML